jgi:quercetin dioxygenase-like cupin family protein
MSTESTSAAGATAAAAMAEHLPVLFTALASGESAFEDIAFEPLVTDGRVGAEIHSLYSTKETGQNGPAAAVVRYRPGAAAKPHRHQGYELIYVFSGELETDDGVFGPNSLLVMEPGSVHAPRSPKGCTTLAVWEQPVQPL